MSLLQAYLSTPRAQRALNRKPGEKGFSLIELVVVVAVLAILSAIALPNFLSITDEASVNGVKNTLATIVKECAVKIARGETGDDLNFNAPELDSSNFVFTLTKGSGSKCASDNEYEAKPKTGYDYATFKVTQGGAKTCSNGSGDIGKIGCKNSKW